MNSALHALAGKSRSLKELEGIISRGISSYIECGKALAEIRDRRLYKVEGHKTFESYCVDRWGWHRRHADRIIAAAQFVGNLSPIGLKSIPANEYQARQALYSSDSCEWYTPEHVIVATSKLLGAIDLDPCANAALNVPAALSYTEEQNGLAQQWGGRVYMNPPYGREITAWVEKLCEEYASGRVLEALALIPARVDTEWFRLFRDFAVCFFRGRLKFSGHKDSAPFPSAAVYLGERVSNFSEVFSEIGDVWVRWQKE